MDIQWEEMAMLASSVPDAVVCLISALSYYDLTDQFMDEVWLAIPNEKGNLNRQGVRFVRLRNMSLGVRKIKIGSKVVFRFQQCHS